MSFLASVLSGAFPCLASNLNFISYLLLDWFWRKVGTTKWPNLRNEGVAGMGWVFETNCLPSVLIRIVRS